MIKRIPSQWETQRCVIHSLDHHVVNDLQSLYNKSIDMTKLDGRTIDPAYAQSILDGKPVLPPNGSVDRHTLQYAVVKGNTQPMALIELYHGYPDERTLYIGFFFIDHELRSKGYGKEIIDQLKLLIKDEGYSSIRVGVALKNWSALRFWTHTGFRHVTKISGDQEYSEHTFALIELSAELSFDKTEIDDIDENKNI